MLNKVTEKVKDLAFAEGFHLVGVSSVEPQSEHLEFYKTWLQKGLGGQMEYLQRHFEKKKNPRSLYPDAKTILCCALSYKTSFENPSCVSMEKGTISNYAWGDDYHEVMNEKLKALLSQIQALIPGAQGEVVVDTAPLLERSFAQQAGIGWIGKNTCVIHPHFGSYIFLGEILLNIDLKKDLLELDHCGSCTRCLEACPTQALTPYELDATRCIAYLTNEKRGEFSKEEKSMIGQHIFGCDICQQVCPWNEKSLVPDLSCFKPRPHTFVPSLQALKVLTQEEFKQIFKNSSVQRAKYKGLMRNVEVAVENSSLVGKSMLV
ncbi:MAG: tRNA epoxyqueuosine(34) reductase QueG [Deltaproteobacteria bacterium]|nr:tRNA epoxyqueuosine(34) reductase QueG [Deltaproteobacteria bacterium]